MLIKVWCMSLRGPNIFFHMQNDCPRTAYPYRRLQDRDIWEKFLLMVSMILTVHADFLQLWGSWGKLPPSPRSRDPACGATVDAGYPWMHQGRSAREPFGIVRGMLVDTSDEFMWDISVGDGKQNLWVLAKGLGSLFAYSIVELIESS